MEREKERRREKEEERKQVRKGRWPSGDVRTAGDI